MLLSPMDALVMRGGVGYIAVTKPLQAEELRRPTSKSASFDQIWQPDLGLISASFDQTYLGLISA